MELRHDAWFARINSAGGIIAIALLLCLILACESSGGSGGGGPDTDVDTDSDTDADTDTDTDTTGICTSGPPCGPSLDCCDQTQECVNDWQCLPLCEHTRCGENLSGCCEAGQICLDGVDCAAECDADQQLCGVNLDICCSAAEVCLDEQCVTPGASCGNNFDCLDDNWYCEETIGECLPLPTDTDCQGTPTFTEIVPALEWHWPGIEYNGHWYQNVIAAPVVGDVNGDGTPDIVVPAYHGDVLKVGAIIVVLDGAGDGSGGGEVLFTIPSEADPSAPYVWSQTAAALGNFDADPGLEIVYSLQGGGVRIADNDGVGDVCDAAQNPGCSGSRLGTSVIRSGIDLADLDHDGMPDVIVGCQALDGHDISDSNLDFINTSCGEDSVVADLNGDNRPEVIDAAHAITADKTIPGGEAFWTTSNGQTSGYIAVADLLPDTPGPEVVNIRNGFYILEGQTGAVLVGNGGSLVDLAINIPGSGTGGPPTIADFDGDSFPEVSTAGQAAYVVYDPDCSDPPLRAGGDCATGATDFILWSTPTQDLSSSITGSSVFDFQGDGPAEVLYNDECFLHIYDGKTGSELVDPVIPNSSRTSAEYPLVADVDGDGNAEIVVVANQDQAINRDYCHIAWKTAGVSIDLLCSMTQCTAGAPCTGGVGGSCTSTGEMCDSSGLCQRPGGTSGVRVLGDANDRWVKTRPVWNQYSYHVTDFEFNSGVWDVPTTEVASWTSYNNYRQNVQGGVLFPVPDLRVSLEATTVCPNEVRLLAKVQNVGSSGAQAGIALLFYRTDAGATAPPELIESKVTTQVLLPGGWERISAVYSFSSAEETMTFSAVLDEGATIEECETSNNTSSDDAAPCPAVR